MLRKYFNYCFFFLTILIIFSCASTDSGNNTKDKDIVDITQNAEIINLNTNQKISSNQLIEELASADMVLVGEIHDSLKQHRLEKWLGEEVTKIRPQGSFVLEMLQPFQQKDFNEVQTYLNNGGYMQGNSIRTKTSWKNSWNWSLYKDLVNYLVRQKAPVLEANLEDTEIKDIIENNYVLEGNYSTTDEVKSTLNKIIANMHNQDTNDSFSPKVNVQQHRDRKMATVLTNAPKPTMFFAGTFHVIKNLGVPLHLKDLKYSNLNKVKVVVLAPLGSTLDKTNADYIWYVE